MEEQHEFLNEKESQMVKNTESKEKLKSQRTKLICNTLTELGNRK